MCWADFSVNTLFGDSAGERLIVAIIEPIESYSSNMSGSNTELDKDNIIGVEVKDLTKEQHDELLALENHVKKAYMMNFWKSRQGLSQVKDFVMPSFSVKDQQIKDIDQVSSSSKPEWFDQVNELIKEQISQSSEQTFSVISDLMVKKSGDLSKGKTVENLDPSSSASPAQPQYDMPLNSCVGQTPPPAECWLVKIGQDRIWIRS